MTGKYDPPFPHCPASSFPPSRLYDYPYPAPPHSPSIHASFPMTLSPSTTPPIQGDHDDDNQDDDDEYIDENDEQ